MPSYTLTARVVLHKDDKRTKAHSPDAAEYETLHAEMHDRGYRRYFTNKAKEKVKLPPGEYVIDMKADNGSEARDKAMKKAKAAATIATSAERFSVLVTGGDNVRGYQLEVIDADPDEETLTEP
ncbi:hypothetical protein B7L17_011700 [Burkholderia cenocepacia]|uniref:hypothetical protein n=1 Tax=Burkholderia cenocepacia TaxID=95486 RepID=UPI002237681C|nr:hypothetical protein [Burkholderia cenocepacia]MCW5118623.1 hypothetical protein [Burkholderia cenocepacia]MCW5130934.1 hypothetical protein [Burkholderia cenocepacia]MCW5174034.1 hypothetical protein [Burkholderia cenocepacia]